MIKQKMFAGASLFALTVAIAIGGSAAASATDQVDTFPQKGVTDLSYANGKWTITLDSADADEVKLISPTQIIACSEHEGQPKNGHQLCDTVSYTFESTADCVMVQVDWTNGLHESWDPRACHTDSSDPTSTSSMTSSPTNTQPGESSPPTTTPPSDEPPVTSPEPSQPPVTTSPSSTPPSSILSTSSSTPVVTIPDVSTATPSLTKSNQMAPPSSAPVAVEALANTGFEVMGYAMGAGLIVGLGMILLAFKYRGRINE